MSQFLKDFRDHPESVGENYGQHWCSAMGFAATMFLCALACAVHAFLPGAFKTTASARITQLYERMVSKRHRHSSGPRNSASERSQTSQRVTAAG